MVILFIAINLIMRFRGKLKTALIFLTIALIILQRFFVDNQLVFYINFSMILVSSFLLYITYNQQNTYTNLAINDLKHSKIEEIRLNAIDILAQKGHKYDILPLDIALTYLCPFLFR